MHECPDCFSGCYCGGDIDDILLGDSELGCVHCPDDIDPDRAVDDPDDCLDCGVCPDCVQRAIDYAEDMADAANAPVTDRKET